MYIYERCAAISIVQHVPRGMENECFRAGAICLRCVRVSNKDRSRTGVRQDYIVRF